MLYHRTTQGVLLTAKMWCSLVEKKMNYYLTRKFRAMGPDFFEKSCSRTLRSICNHLRWPLPRGKKNKERSVHQKSCFQTRTNVHEYSEYLTVYILVITKCKSKEFLLFEVEVGGNQVEEFVRQKLGLWKEDWRSVGKPSVILHHVPCKNILMKVSRILKVD